MANRPVNRFTPWLLPIILLVFFLCLRLPGLGRYATIDEVYWLKQSANFRQAILDGRWNETALSWHPGATTMWAGFLGIQLRYAQLDNFPHEGVTDFHLRHYLWDHQINPIELIASARLCIVLFNALAFLLLWSPLRRLVGDLAATLGMGLIAFDPYLIAHQRLLHQDGMMAGLGLLALVAFAAYLKSKRRSDFILSAVATGLACLTKTPMLLLIPVIILMGVYAELRRGHLEPGVWVRRFAVWVLIVAVVFGGLWPAMWVNPVGSIVGMGQYALGSAQGEFSGPVFFNGTVYPTGDLGSGSWSFYVLSLLWRATPFVLLGMLLAIGALLWRRAQAADLDARGFWFLPVFAVLFVALMSVGVKKFDRYMLPAYAALLPVAGWGWAQVAAWASTALPVATALGASRPGRGHPGWTSVEQRRPVPLLPGLLRPAAGRRSRGTAGDDAGLG